MTNNSIKHHRWLARKWFTLVMSRAGVAVWTKMPSLLNMVLNKSVECDYLSKFSHHEYTILKELYTYHKYLSSLGTMTDSLGHSIHHISMQWANYMMINPHY